MCSPMRFVNTRPMVPLPLRFGPISCKRLLLARVGGQAVSERLLQGFDRFVVLGPQLVQELEPLPRFGGVRVVSEVKGIVVEVRRRVRQEHSGRQMQQPIGAGDEFVRRRFACAVEPHRRLDRGVELRGGA